MPISIKSLTVKNVGAVSFASNVEITCSICGHSEVTTGRMTGNISCPKCGSETASINSNGAQHESLAKDGE